MNAKTPDDVLRRFLEERLIPLKTKLDDFLPVVLGVRPCAQIIMPAELPDGTILGATIDEKFRLRSRGTGLDSVGRFVRSRLGRGDPASDVRRRMQLLREIYTEVVTKSHSYQAYVRWMDELGLERKELESRPTIREIYVFRDPSIAAKLDELQDLRKDIRYDVSKVGGSGPAYTRAFPEEKNAAYLRKLGDILGFPACCVQRYVFDRTTGLISPEERASNDLKELERPEDLDVFAYFTKDFFPCKPDCDAASQIGRETHQKLLSIDAGLADQYLENLRSNAELVRRYPEFIKERIASLERSRTEEGTKPRQT